VGCVPALAANNGHIPNGMGAGAPSQNLGDVVALSPQRERVTRAGIAFVTYAFTFLGSGQKRNGIFVFRAYAETLARHGRT
jgi:hypothetical protein